MLKSCQDFTTLIQPYRGAVWNGFAATRGLWYAPKMPTEFSPELAQEICGMLATGQTLREVCRRPEMPSEAAVRLWALENRDGFGAQYTRARELGYLSMADEIIDISDDGLNDWIERRRADGSTETVVDHEHISRSKLRFDARRWLLSKCLPKIYGDKLEHTGPDGGPIAVTVAKFTPGTDGES